MTGFCRSSTFLSTLSLRRATRAVSPFSYKSLNFYPRSPCGERPGQVAPAPQGCAISIHALLAESDPLHPRGAPALPDFYPRSPCGERLLLHMMADTTYIFLSTLSLQRATERLDHEIMALIFLSTLSLRRATGACIVARPVLYYFYPRSPCGERP